MFCSQCGNSISTGDAFCPNCGMEVRAVKDTTSTFAPSTDHTTRTSFAPTSQPYSDPYNQPYYNRPKEDSLNAGYWICIFCVPIVGIVIYFQRKNDRPNSANTALVIAIVSFVIGILTNL